MMAVIGLFSMLAGAALITWGARHLGGDPDERNDSLLAPTLAVDTLDPDLRVLYMQTLVLDAKCSAEYGESRRADWAPVGRELRRALVATQSRRVRELSQTSADGVKGLVERALEHVQSGGALDDEWDSLRRSAADRPQA